MNILKRVYIWCCRFRFRKGHGVHSPFAFELITDVIEECRPYYAYQELKEQREHLPYKSQVYPERVDKLLFRLVNRFQPTDILEVGTGSGLSLLYMASGKWGTRCVSLCGEKVAAEALDLVERCNNVTLHVGPLTDTLGKELDATPNIGLLHIAHTDDYEWVFEQCVGHVESDTLFVIEGIHQDKDKSRWWSRIVTDERTCVTFDLYEVGLVFFDRSKNKQHYVVNF